MMTTRTLSFLLLLCCLVCSSFNKFRNEPPALATNPYTGCCGTEPVVFAVGAVGSVYVPNVVTPNYDGLNDIFHPFINNRIATIKDFYIHEPNSDTIIFQADTLLVVDASSQTLDATGKAISATDNGGTLNYEYNSFGNQTKVKIGTTDITTMTYDNYGRQTQLNDKDGGITTYDYNAFGELASQTDANGNSHTMTYDLMGRIKDRVGTEGTTLYEYVTANSGKNLIKKVTGFNGILQEYTYDAFNHMTEDKETVDGIAHPTNYTYNTYGDVTSVTYPSGFIVNKLYNTKGFLTELKNAGLTVTLFSASSMNAYGQYTGFTLGNGVASTRSFDDYGFPTNFTATGKQNLSMSFNAQNGNMGSRNDILKGLSESFTYDNLNRLLDATVSGQAAQSATYAPAGTTTGNISTKTGVGSYTYDPLKIHAVTMVTNPGSVVPTGTQTIAYTPYHQPATITDGGDQVAITYGPDYQRRKMTTSKFGSVTGARYYFGSYEKNVAGSTTTHLHYIGCGAGLVAMVHRNNSGGDTYYYTYTDHLGSILTVTNDAGTVQAEQSFDAWGRTRNPSTWAYTGVTGPPSWLYRGYTGHEHLANFGLINMNGRVHLILIFLLLNRL